MKSKYLVRITEIRWIVKIVQHVMSPRLLAVYFYIAGINVVGIVATTAQRRLWGER